MVGEGDEAVCGRWYMVDGVGADIVNGEGGAVVDVG
jgi:hypothetical protein